MAAGASVVSGGAQCEGAGARIRMRYFAEFCLTYLAQLKPLPPSHTHTHTPQLRKPYKSSRTAFSDYYRSSKLYSLMFALYPKDMQPMSEPYAGPEKGWRRCNTLQQL